MDKAKAAEIYENLKIAHPDVKCALNHSTPYELLCATVLSAQCTDVRVNAVTEVLYKKAHTPDEMISLGYEELEKTVHSCGLSASKTKNIIALSGILCEKFNGEVPDTMEELITLPGVGRKTANVVLANAFGKNAIAVDTHVQRVSNRIGLAHSGDVLKTERQLMDILEERTWSLMHHLLIWHGRRVCHARKPECATCTLFDLCEWADKNEYKSADA